jgi:hypothetical protein
VIRRLGVAAVAAFAAVIFGCTCAGAAIVAGQAASTCTPRKIIYTGEYRVDNDLFAGSPGRLCITSAAGHDFTITTAATGDGSDGTARTVIAYPKIYVGQNYTSADPLSGLPASVAASSSLTMHLRAAGQTTAVSNYITDIDLWLSPTVALAGDHGSTEVVVAMRWQHAGMGGGRKISMAGHWYLILPPWSTGPGCGTPQAIDQLTCWPIVRIVAYKQVTSRALRVGKIFWHLRKLGYLHATILDSADFGTELWRGGKGLTDSLVVTR